MNRISLIVFMFTCCVAALGGCASSGASGRGGDPGVLRIATDATFPPFHFENYVGDTTGYDVELARELATRAGLTPRVFIVRPYDRLWTGLADGEFDVVAATTGITEERQEIWLFTEPYYTTAQCALVRAGDFEPRILTDLQGLTIGAAGSGTSWLAAQSIRGATAVQLGKGQEGIPALHAGRIDALIVDEYEAVRAARESNGRYRVLREPVTIEEYAVVLPKNAKALKRALDQALESMREDGTIEELQRRFGLRRTPSWPVAIPSR